ncbi:hypothetical protein [Porcipelethomonas sp.]|uniref:hypothetical protein n=1 Tax=Porcipelethomonas sp. TaxID=2981675 RepID=UPI003EF1BC8A
MKTNNQQGRNIALIAGIYFIVKSVINLILGGGFMDVIISVLEAAALYTGLMYLNYIVAAIVAIVAIVHLPANIGHLADNWFYLLEGVIDIIAAIIICVNPSVKEHFTNKWGGGSNE